MVVDLNATVKSTGRMNSKTTAIVSLYENKSNIQSNTQANSGNIKLLITAAFY